MGFTSNKVEKNNIVHFKLNDKSHLKHHCEDRSAKEIIKYS